MEEDSITAAQSLIEEQKYPPTHTYDVRTLEPSKVLAERLEVILQLCPEFFEADRFLDVGASKGFFSLRAARESDEVVAVEPDREVLNIWAPLLPPNVTQLCATFRELSLRALGTFDVIWVGNGHHYLHREDPVDWVLRLALFAWDHVLVEGPIDGTTPGFGSWAPGTVPEEAEWLAKARCWGLKLVGRELSPAYTPGRAIWHLRKTR